MQAILKFFSEKQIGLITYSGNIKYLLNQQVFKLLKSFGFIIRKHSNEFIVRNLNYSNEINLYDVRNWYINDLWSEGV